EKDVSLQNESHPYVYGFWNIKNNVIVDPEYYDIDINAIASANKLSYVNKDGLYGYVDQNGKLVWLEDSKDTSAHLIDTLNIDVMNRAYCFASSSKDSSRLDGFGG
ncbi:MAG TPA: hypothetical protein VNZ45_17070, partial [Bacteroidia bacterium]|nr:hypothetical protein [Bacteroidia bacterium]